MTLGFLLLLATSIGTLSAADKISCETCFGVSCLVPLEGRLRECPSANDSCVSAFCDSMILARGCASEIELPRCEPEAKLVTSVCTEGRCDSVSTRDAPSCVQCDQATNRNCLVNSATLPSTPCLSGSTKCYTKLDDNGRISRGCFNQLSAGDQINCESEFQQNCVTCNSIGCNRDILPANRLKCHQCDLSTDPSCNTAKSPRTATYCEEYSEDNKCLTVIRNPKEVRRLCTASPATLCTNALSCAICEADGCNHEGVTVTEIHHTPCPTPPPPPTLPPTSPPPTSPPTTQPPPTCPTCPTQRPPSPAPSPTPAPNPNGVSPILPGALATLTLALLSLTL